MLWLVQLVPAYVQKVMLSFSFVFARIPFPSLLLSAFLLNRSNRLQYVVFASYRGTSRCKHVLSSGIMFWQAEIFAVRNVHFFSRHHCFQWSSSCCLKFLVKISPIPLMKHDIRNFYLTVPIAFFSFWVSLFLTVTFQSFSEGDLKLHVPLYIAKVCVPYSKA